MNKERKKLIRSIHRYIEDIEIDDRRYLLNIIAENYKDLLYEEGTGTRILYKVISNKVLRDMNEFIQEAKKKTKLSF